MGHCKPEDQPAICTPATVVTGGLFMIGGAIAGIVYGVQANEQQAGSGNAAIAAGTATILAAIVTMSGAINALCFKIRDIIARDDDDAAADQGPQLDQIVVNLNAIQKQAAADADKLERIIA